MLKKRKYRLLYTAHRKGKPGPKGPSQELIEAIVELKQRNPRFGCPRIAQEINKAFGVHAGDADGVALCRMFNTAISTGGAPKYLSSDNDPLFQYQQWQANLRILDVDELKSIPYTPCSHPFIERLIGTIRREFLDHTLFWNAPDLKRKLADFQTYYNHHRTHSSLGDDTPAEFAGDTPRLQPTLNNFRWQTHCRGIYQLPVAA